MPPQSIVIQVGQCGNQMGARFWDNIYNEYKFYQTKSHLASSVSTFFDEQGPKLKARAVLVDMEQGVLSQIEKSEIGHLFDPHQYISSPSGSGNNWGQGYNEYGQLYGDSVMEAIRQQAELCDALDSFFILHSLGGGTGSGLGSRITERVSEEYPTLWKFNACVQPSQNDDVVTSPYNTQVINRRSFMSSVLSLAKLVDSSDCVLPIENQALFDIYEKIEQSGGRACQSLSSNLKVNSKCKSFDAMNNIVAKLLMNLTSSMRFDGSVNVDMNDITSNLIPFPDLKFLISSMAPLYSLPDSSHKSMDAMFTDAFLKDNYLIKDDPRKHMFLASAVIARGDVGLSDVKRNIDRIKTSLTFPSWNEQGWKIGLCRAPPLGHVHAVLGLSNNTCISMPFRRIGERFSLLYRKKANLHHYLEYMEKQEFDKSIHALKTLVETYEAHEIKP